MKRLIRLINGYMNALKRKQNAIDVLVERVRMLSAERDEHEALIMRQYNKICELENKLMDKDVDELRDLAELAKRSLMN